MGLQSWKHDAYIFSGTISDDNSSILQTTPCVFIHACLYVDDFIFYSTSQAEEELFQTTSAKYLQIDSMGGVNYCLGIAFNWTYHDAGHISVHLQLSHFT